MDFLQPLSGAFNAPQAKKIHTSRASYITHLYVMFTYLKPIRLHVGTHRIVRHQ